MIACHHVGRRMKGICSFFFYFEFYIGFIFLIIYKNPVRLKIFKYLPIKINYDKNESGIEGFTEKSSFWAYMEKITDGHYLLFLLSYVVFFLQLVSQESYIIAHLISSHIKIMCSIFLKSYWDWWVSWSGSFQQNLFEKRSQEPWGAEIHIFNQVRIDIL